MTEHPHSATWLRWLPSAFRQGKAKEVLGFCVVMGSIVMGFMAISPYPDTDMLHVPLLLLLLVLLVSVQRGMRLALAVNVGTAAGLVLLFTVAWYSGGIFSPRMGWLLMLPLLPFYVGGRRTGMVWAALVLLAQTVMAVCTRSGHVPPFAPNDAHVLTSWYTFAAIMLMQLWVPLIYERLNRRILAARQARQHELEQQRLALEHTLQMRKDFLATISHELRTPMNAILGFNTWLRTQVQNKPEAVRALQHTCSSAEHLMTVINDTLDYSQLQAGQVATHPEVFELRPVVTQSFELFLPRIPAQGLAYHMVVDPQLPSWVYGDRHRLTQVLVNLLGNALKFTAQGHVTLHVQALGDGVQFAVQDTGIGIAPEKHGQIFQRFGQADSGIQARFGGHGLGLAISKKLVELLGGQIGFESQSGQGSRFWFTLPLQAQPAPANAGASGLQRIEVTTGERAWRFLIVDDHPINRVLAKKVLQTAWPHAQFAEVVDGQKCLAHLAQHPVDLVVMDMVMPELDGIETTRLLRQNPAWQQLPVLGLTANVNPADLEGFGASGLSDVMLKPFEPAQLCALAEMLLLRQQAAAAAALAQPTAPAPTEHSG